MEATFDLSEILPDPKMVGTAEYHAVWDLVQCTEDFSEGDFTTVTAEQADFMCTQLEEMASVAREKLKSIRELLQKHGAAPAQQ